MEGNGPINGDPANADVLIASLDALAAEVVAINLMGFDINDPKLKYIEMAYEAGFGECDLNKIRIVGDDVKLHFKKSLAFSDLRHNGTIKLEAGKACSACRFNLDCALNKVNSNAIENSPITIFAGSPQKTEAEFSIGIGNCCRSIKDAYDEFVPGCPPNVNKIYSAILEGLNHDNCKKNNNL